MKVIPGYADMSDKVGHFRYRYALEKLDERLIKKLMERYYQRSKFAAVRLVIDRERERMKAGPPKGAYKAAAEAAIRSLESPAAKVYLHGWIFADHWKDTMAMATGWNLPDMSAAVRVALRVQAVLDGIVGVGELPTPKAVAA